MDKIIVLIIFIIFSSPVVIYLYSANTCAYTLPYRSAKGLIRK